MQHEATIIFYTRNCNPNQPYMYRGSYPRLAKLVCNRHFFHQIMVGFYRKMLSVWYVCVLLFRGIGYSTIPINLVLVYKNTIIYYKKRGEASPC